MKSLSLFTIFFTLLCCTGVAQSTKTTSKHHFSFPQKDINASINKAFISSTTMAKANVDATKPVEKSSTYSVINKMNEVKKMKWENYTHPNQSKVLDTVYVGATPHDTLIITGNYTHTGPIFVFNDGVLIFYHATATNYGDVYVFQQGTLIGDSSSLTFPQQYFYQRSLIVVQHGTAFFNTCSFDYSGVQHNLVIGDSGVVGMQNVHQRDWTTCGIYGKGTIEIHGLNLGGEYILSDSSNCLFSNVDTLLLWHKMPNTAVINYSFPQGDTVMNYHFNNTVSGVAGVGYNVYADSCHNVWWAMMPVNGSNVTISNSNVRAVGEWFEHGDTATVSALNDNTFYGNTVIPFTDRTMHLLNTNVITWNLYAFDTSRVNITNSTVGEVGTEQKANISAQQFLLDGSGGYFWATDTSVIFANNVTIYSTARSERNGIFVLAYSTMPFSTPSSIGSSVMVSVQNSIVADPVPFDGSIMWLENIESPAVAHADSLIQVRGSVWIDHGPNSNWMDFANYSLYYQLQGASSWTPIVVDSLLEIRHNTLGVWNTTGLVAGNYILRLVGKNNFADTIEDFKAITIIPAVTVGINDNNNANNFTIAPNPFASETTITFDVEQSNSAIKVVDALGKERLNITHFVGKKLVIQKQDLAAGVYFVKVTDAKQNTVNRKLVIK